MLHKVLCQPNAVVAAPFSIVCLCTAGQPFAVAGGPNGKQGMLHATLRDKLASCAIVAATTHLKAKAGQVRELSGQTQLLHAAFPGSHLLCEIYQVASVCP